MNEMLPQSPPDAPAPPPSEAALRSQRMMRWLLALGIFSVIVVFVLGLVTPQVLSSTKKGDRAEAAMNAKQIGLALFGFEQDYGSFPSAATVPVVQSKNPGSNIPLGKSSSNDCFRQLLVSECIDQEKPFYAKNWSKQRPDNDMDGAKALEKGETSFSYIEGLSSSNYSSAAPIVMTPLVKGKRLFDYKLCKKYYDGRAVILFHDMSVIELPVDKSGHVYINGKDLFDPSQPFWNGKVPDVKWPE